MDVVLRLGVDPRKADQMVRDTVSLPHGTGKTARVVVFAQGERAQQALDAGADEVGDDDLIARVAAGWTDFDAAVATPDLMGRVGRLGRVLGLRGLMPNPKTGQAAHCKYAHIKKSCINYGSSQIDSYSISSFFTRIILHFLH